MDATELGSQIREIRKERGWTQAKLGEQCGVQKAQISKIEKDATRASLDIFFKICTALNLEIRVSSPFPVNNKNVAADPNENHRAILEKLSSDERSQLKREAERILYYIGVDEIILEKLSLDLREQLNRVTRETLSQQYGRSFVISPIVKQTMVTCLNAIKDIDLADFEITDNLDAADTNEYTVP